MRGNTQIRRMFATGEAAGAPKTRRHPMLRHIDERGLTSILESNPAASPLQQEVFEEAERTDATLFLGVQRRCGKVRELITQRLPGANAELVQHLALAAFRGFSAVDTSGGTVVCLRHNTVRGNGLLYDGEPLEVRTDDGWRECEDYHILRSPAIDLVALPVVLRSLLTEERYGIWLERYGIPSVIIERPQNDRIGNAEWVKTAEAIASAASGVIPYGTQIHYPGNSGPGADVFKDALEFYSSQITRLCTGGTLTSIASSTGIGGGASDVQQDTWKEICRDQAEEVLRAYCGIMDIDMPPEQPAPAEEADDTRA